MTTYEAQTDIARSADEVWTYAADILHHPDWMSVRSARVLAGDGAQVGARGVGRQPSVRSGRHRFEVAEAEPDAALWRSTTAVRLGDRPRAGAERADIRASEVHGAAQMHGRWRLLSPLVAMEGSAGVKRELAQLKARVEGAPAAVAAAS